MATLPTRRMTLGEILAMREQNPERFNSQARQFFQQPDTPFTSSAAPGGGPVPPPIHPKPLPQPDRPDHIGNIWQNGAESTHVIGKPSQPERDFVTIDQLHQDRLEELIKRRGRAKNPVLRGVKLDQGDPEAILEFLNYMLKKATPEQEDFIREQQYLLNKKRARDIVERSKKRGK